MESSCCIKFFCNLFFYHDYQRSLHKYDTPKNGNMQYRNKTIKTGQYSNEVIKMSKNIQNVNDLINSNVHAKEYYLKLSEAARGNVEV